MLEICNLTKRFSKNKALDDFSFSFDNRIYALLGPNGSGKTTLMRCLTGLYPITSGEIRFDGENVTKNKSFYSHIGYLPQSFGLFRELTVLESLELVANLKGIEKSLSRNQIEEALEFVNLEDRLKSRIGELSGGMVRRLGIAQAIMGNPKIIILDEPTAGLDPEERMRFKNIINRIGRDKMIIISTHIVDDVEAVCDDIVIIKSGKNIRSGSVDDIKALADNKTYTVDVDELKKLNSGEYAIVKTFNANGRQTAEIISSTPLPYEKADSQLEGGYLCALKNI